MSPRMAWVNPSNRCWHSASTAKRRSIVPKHRRMRQPCDRHITDFRSQAKGSSIDDMTLCCFRRDQADRRKDSFLQIVLVACCAGIVRPTKLACDGTNIRADNRRSMKNRSCRRLRMTCKNSSTPSPILCLLTRFSTTERIWWRWKGATST